MSTEQGVSDDAAPTGSTTATGPSTTTSSTPKGLRVLDDNGAWCWFQDERTLADPATGTVVVGSVASAGGQDGAARGGDVQLAVGRADGTTARAVLHAGGSARARTRRGSGARSRRTRGPRCSARASPHRDTPPAAA